MPAPARWSRYRSDFTERTRFQAQEFFLFVDPRQLFAVNIAVMLLGAVLAWVATGSLVVAIPVFFALALLPRLLYAGMRSRRRQKFEQQLPDALMMLSGGLRAGVGLNAAMQQLVSEAHPPLAQEFMLMLREQRLGVTLEQSLNNLARRMPTQTTVLVVSAMRIASDTGGGLAETLERTAHTIRSRLQMEGKIAALTAQGKLQAWVVSLLPMLLMLVLDTHGARGHALPVAYPAGLGHAAWHRPAGKHGRVCDPPHHRHRRMTSKHKRKRPP